MSGKQASLLESLIDIIKQTADPDRIILFGSRGRDTAHPQRDYDFLVVVPHVENERHISRRIYRALLEQHIDAPVDIVVVDGDTLERHHDTPGMIYRQALAEGEVAYDRSRA
ncbi:MAG: nucleotidyltransferase domain-containing protein [Anaerolineae bacterium]|nr:nucleotidyltransferase domain-containing protein [Anaerolineae bacterium]